MTGIEPVASSLPRKRSTPELHRQQSLSGKRDSNPPPTAWKAVALPDELFPLLMWGGKDSNLRRRKPTDLQSAPFDRSGTPPDIISISKSRWRDSNPRPADYKSAALAN